MKKRPQRSQCGLFDCPECDRQRAQRCAGCLAENLALRRRGEPTCAAYDCVREQRIESCWVCARSDCPFLHETVPLRLADAPSDVTRQRCQAQLTSLQRRRERNLRIAAQPPLTGARLARARWYLAALDEMQHRDIRRVCSYDLARATGVRSALVRRDLSSLGHFGTPSLGYDVARLRGAIADAFGMKALSYWVGAAALAANPTIAEQFVACGCPLAGVFDPDEEQAGRTVSGMQVRPLAEIAAAVASDGISTAVLALPPLGAQEVLDTMVESGIRGVLSLVSAPLTAPPYVTLQQADLPSQLFLLLARSRR